MRRITPVLVAVGFAASLAGAAPGYADVPGSITTRVDNLLNVAGGTETLPLLITLAEATPEDREQLEGWLRNGHDPGDILTLIERYGGVERALDEARGYAERASGELGELRPVDSEAFEQLAAEDHEQTEVEQEQCLTGLALSRHDDQIPFRNDALNDRHHWGNLPLAYGGDVMYFPVLWRLKWPVWLFPWWIAACTVGNLFHLAFWQRRIALHLVDSK